MKHHAPHKNNTILGTVKRHPDGFGFVLPVEDGVPDVFISRDDMQGVMSNDKVEVEVFKSAKSDKFYGKIVRITDRAVSRIVGKYEKLDNGDGRIVDGINQWGQSLKIPFRSSRGAVHGDLVAAEITQYPMQGQDFTGRIVEIIGDANDPLNDIPQQLCVKLSF
jgi:ribonuclease R